MRDIERNHTVSLYHCIPLFLYHSSVGLINRSRLIRAVEAFTKALRSATSRIFTGLHLSETWPNNEISRWPAAMLAVLQGFQMQRMPHTVPVLVCRCRGSSHLLCSLIWSLGTDSKHFGRVFVMFPGRI